MICSNSFDQNARWCNALPAIETPSYYVDEGYYEQAQNIAVQEYSNPDNSLLERGTFLTLAALEEPANLFEGAVRSMVNAPAYANIAAQSFAAASITTSPVDRANYLSQGLGYSGTSLLGLAGVGGMLRSSAAGAMLDQSVSQIGRGVANSNVMSLSANEVRLSQRTVSFSKIDRVTGERYTYDDLVSSMRTNGWKGDPVDVV